MSIYNYSSQKLYNNRDKGLTFILIYDTISIPNERNMIKLIDKYNSRKRGKGMRTEDIRDGDIVEIDYIAKFTKEHINEGKALVLWKGFNNQPLIMRLDRKEYYPIWSCYERISKVVGHIPIWEILKDKVKNEE